MGNNCSHLPYSVRGASNYSKDSSSSSNRMESLPDELLMNILSRVPTLDLLQLSFVCRRWRNILGDDPLFRRLHYTLSMSNPNENRVLVLKTELKLHLVDFAKKKSNSPRELAIELPRIPDIKSYCLIGSCNGLLCLGSTKCSKIIVINPITSQHVVFSVPLRFGWEHIISWGFGFDESSKLFKVVIITMGFSSFKLVVSVCDLGSGGSTNWRSLGEAPFCPSRFIPHPNWTITNDVSKSPTCFLNGRLHWAYYDPFSVISFDLTDEEFRRTPAPDGLVDAEFSYLITFGGCLGIVHYQSFQAYNLQIWVMKDYGVEASWVKEIDIQPLLPRTLDANIFWKFSIVLGSVKDSELVLLNKKDIESTIMFSSNSAYSRFKRLKLKGISNLWYDLIVHTASFNWV